MIQNLIFNSFKYLDYIKAKSSVTNALYPYTGVQATCQTVATITSPANPVMRVVQYDLNGDETQLKNIISQDGKKISELKMKKIEFYFF